MVLEAYRTNKNLSHEERKSLSKLAKLTEERKIVICRADKDGKIVIPNYVVLTLLISLTLCWPFYVSHLLALLADDRTDDA